MKNENMKKEVLECVANPDVNRRYTIEFETSEFTALYEKTGQPIFAHIAILYVPDKKCLEQMSLKQYLGSFRSARVYYEEVVNRMVDDLVGACNPVALKVTGRFAVRGGITTVVIVRHGEEGL